MERMENFVGKMAQETATPKKERTRKKEKIVSELIKERLIVKDGYNWDSLDPPRMLPTMYHGTSEYFLENILKNGLRPEEVDLETIEREEPRIASALKMALKKYQRNRISITLSYKVALDHAKKTPERYTNAAVEEDITFQGKGPRGEKRLGGGRWALEDFPRDSEVKRLFLSVFKPMPVVVSVHPTQEDIDREVIQNYDPRIQYFFDPEYRKEFLSNILEQQIQLGKYLEEKRLRRGKTSFDLASVEKLHRTLGGKFVWGIPRNKTEAGMFAPGEIAEILFRDSFYELPVRKIPADKITDIERPRKSDKKETAE